MASNQSLHLYKMKYTISSITKKEAGDWLRLRNLLWEGDDHISEIEKYFSGILEEPNEVLIAKDNLGNVVGHVELSIREDIDGLVGKKTGYIEGLYIEEDHRFCSLSRVLLRASENWARSRGCVAFASDREDRVIIHVKYQAIVT